MGDKNQLLSEKLKVSFALKLKIHQQESFCFCHDILSFIEINDLKKKDIKLFCYFKSVILSFRGILIKKKKKIYYERMIT